MSTSGNQSAASSGGLQIVPAADKKITPALPPRPPSSSSALVQYKPPEPNAEDEDLEIKLRRIIDCIPVRVTNASGSSAGSGSGDFHQYRQMRRKEQDRLARMDKDYEKRKAMADFNMRREERLKAAEERTAKKRSKRQKKKQRNKEKKAKMDSGAKDHQQEESSDDDGDSEDGEAGAI